MTTNLRTSGPFADVVFCFGEHIAVHAVEGFYIFSGREANARLSACSEQSCPVLQEQI
jgi:hypothetical protein